MKYTYLNDEKNIFEEKEQPVLKFLYKTISGRLILKIVTKRKISCIVAYFLNSSLSKIMIKKYIKKNNIDINRFEEKKYKSFNDFFTRKLKSEITKEDEEYFIATADSKVSYYEISKELVINIKNSKYSISELLKDSQMAKKYEGGICIIYRLAPSDYHRYIFIDDGIQEKIKKIDGILHTVNPIIYSNNKYKVFTENFREVSKLKTKNFGDIIQIEVGALCVGKINNNDNKSFLRYDEKGYFEFGGSTIIQLIQKDKVLINKTIINNTEVDIETKVDVGEKIGIKIKSGE